MVPVTWLAFVYFGGVSPQQPRWKIIAGLRDAGANNASSIYAILFQSLLVQGALVLLIAISFPPLPYIW